MTREQSNNFYLALIIPAYNEASRIQDTLHNILNYLVHQSYSWEVIVVDDGSTDSTADLVRSVSKVEPRIKLISTVHRGKGSAVGIGMLETNAEHRFLCDADLSMPIEQLDRFLPPKCSDYDIAIGSREIEGSKRIGEPVSRHIMGRIYNFLVRYLAVPGIADTQCGFKMIKGTVADKLFANQKIQGFAFDVELLFRAYKSKYKIMEIPIDWYHEPQSKVNRFKDSIVMAMDVIKVRWHHATGSYNNIETL